MKNFYHHLLSLLYIRIIRIKMIACGYCYKMIPNEKNEIYVCGHNRYGQLGLGDKKDRDKFEKVEKNFGEIKKIACSYRHTVIQNEKNEIYVCGENEYGQLGLGDNKDRNKFEKAEYDFGKIKNIECGGSHTMIQNEKNEIYVCGCNAFGQLGLGNSEDKYKFEKVEYDIGEIKKIACGYCHTIVQNKKNEIYVCGRNDVGQLGLGDYEIRNKFEKVNCDFGKIKNMVCNFTNTVIQNEKNEIYVCGDNYCGQLGLGDNYSRNKYEKVDFDFGEIKNIACGYGHTIIQNEKNEIYVCGDNYYGQLGLGDNYNRNKYEKVEYDFGEIKKIACGGHHTVIQNEKNEVYVCGDNEYGHLGLGDHEYRNIFEKVNTDDIFEKIYNFELRLNTGEIVL